MSPPTQSKPAVDDPKRLLKNRNPNQPITHTDGLVGAIWNHYFITSPNMGHIPSLVSSSDLILRRDYFYGVDDYLIWPQPYNGPFCHLSTIRRAPLADEEDQDWIMWERYNERTHFTWPDDDSCVSGYGNLKASVADELSVSISRLLEKTKDRQRLLDLGTQPPTLEYLHTIRLNLEFTFSRLKGMPCTKEDAHRGWVELQRAWIVLDALWEFLALYRGRINGSLPPASYNQGSPLKSRLMGAYTHDERTAQHLYAAGIPVWLVRPLHAFTNQNILSIVQMEAPRLCADILPRARCLVSGHMGSTQKFKAIEANSHRFSLHPDPFEIVAFDSQSERNPRSPTIPNTVARPSRVNHHRHRHKPYPPSHSRPTSDRPRHPTSEQSDDRGPQGGKIYQKAVRDKFARWEGSFVPPVIPTWAIANEQVDQESRRERELERRRRDYGYFFPDPGLFFGVEKEWKAAEFMRQWQHLKSVWILRVYTDSATPCSPQEWRDILSLGILTSHNNDTGRLTATAKAVERVRGLIGSCLKAAGMVEHSLSRPLPRCELQAQVVDIRKGRQLIWELSELNFRWELQALDRCLYDRRRYGKLQRQKMLMRCFPDEVVSISNVHPSQARAGLASPTFSGRLPFLQALWDLMDCWPVPKPSIWDHGPVDPTISPEGDNWERELTRFYAQTFFEYFSRPAILPHTLSIDDSNLV